MFYAIKWCYRKFPVAAYATKIAYGKDQDDFRFLGIFCGMGFDKIT